MTASDTSFDSSEAPARWSQVFLGVLTNPETTFLSMLNSEGYFKDEKSSQVFFIVLFAAIGMGLSLARPDQVYLSILAVIFSVFCSLIVWTTIAYLLVGIAKYLKKRKVNIITSVILTGWAHLPLIFYPSIYCLNGALGQAVEILAALPLIGFVYLLLVAFKVSLDISYSRVMIVFFVTPPLIALTITFWIIVLVSYATLKMIPLII